jgi:hypothetical protein
MSERSMEVVVSSTCGNDRAKTSSNRDSSGQNVVMEGFGSSVAVSHRTDWYLARVGFPNVWELFLAYPFLNVLLFRM